MNGNEFVNDSLLHVPEFGTVAPDFVGKFGCGTPATVAGAPNT